MEFSASQIAEIVNGKVDGNAEVKVNYVSKIEEGKKGTLSFLANPKYKSFIYDTEASIVLVNHDFKPEKEVKPTMIRVDDAYTAFAKLLEFYNKAKLNKSGISPKAYISSSAKSVIAAAIVSSNAEDPNIKLIPSSISSVDLKLGINNPAYCENFPFKK